MKALGCENDEARSMKICYVPGSIKITVYDDGENRGFWDDKCSRFEWFFGCQHERVSDDFAVVSVWGDIHDDCLTIDTFEKSKTYGEKANVYYVPHNGLDGKVSSFKVDWNP